MAILVRLITVCSVLLSGLIAGSMLGTGLSLYSSHGLPDAGWTQHFQLEDALFARVMPPLLQAQLLLFLTATLYEYGMRRTFLRQQRFWRWRHWLSRLVLKSSRQIDPVVGTGRRSTRMDDSAGPVALDHLYRAVAALLAFVAA